MNKFEILFSVTRRREREKTFVVDNGENSSRNLKVISSRSLTWKLILPGMKNDKKLKWKRVSNASSLCSNYFWIARFIVDDTEPK